MEITIWQTHMTLAFLDSPKPRVPTYTLPFFFLTDSTSPRPLDKPFTPKQYVASDGLWLPKCSTCGISSLNRSGWGNDLKIPCSKLGEQNNNANCPYMNPFKRHVCQFVKLKSICKLLYHNHVSYLLPRICYFQGP